MDAMGIMKIYHLLEHVVVEVKKMGNGNQVKTKSCKSYLIIVILPMEKNDPFL